MKKLIVICMVSWIALSMFPINACSQTNGYVNLGLPSGTLWKDRNETGLYDYDAAVQKFGRMLPTKSQVEELKSNCQWMWTGSGFKVVGPNGKSIFLPASGGRHCDGSTSEVQCGYYWSSTPSDYDAAWDLDFMLFTDSGAKVFVGNIFRCHRSSVRLVK